MHVLIFAPTLSTGEEMQAALGDAADRYTIVTIWPDVLASIADVPPDLIVIQRDVLARLEPTTLLNLMEPGRWPTLMLADSPAAAIREGVALVRSLAQKSPSVYRVGDLRIDTRKKRAGLGDSWVTLPPLQYRLLLTLAKKAGEVVGYQDLLREVWGYTGQDNEARELLKVHIRQIRRRLGLDPEEHPYIRSVRGFGYMLAPPEED